MRLSQKHALAIAEAHEIEQLFQDEEEVFFLSEHNPELHDAYIALLDVAGIEMDLEG